MCIRDSAYTGKSFRNLIRRDEQESCQKSIWSQTVSYTHLDVYKRQVRESSLATNLVFSRVCEEFDNQI